MQQQMMMQYFMDQQRRQQQQQQIKSLGKNVSSMFGGKGLKDVMPDFGLDGLFGGGGAEAVASGAESVSPVALGPGGSSGLFGAPATTGMGSIGFLPAAGIAGGVALGAKGLKDLMGGKSGTDSIEGLGGRATLGIATGGLSEVARLGGVGQKSTKQYQDDRWGKLSPAAQGLRAANHSENDDGVWDTGKYAGQKWSFDKALDLAKEDPTHFAGVLGNVETFGDDWLSLDPTKRNQIVSQLANEGMYHSNKGDVLIEDGKKDRAKQIYDSVVSSSSTPLNIINKPQSSGGQSSNFVFRDGGNSSSPDDVMKQIESRYGSSVAQNYTPEGGTGGAGYEPDPNRPGHFRKRK
jgi:hypothetical protein